MEPNSPWVLLWCEPHWMQIPALDLIVEQFAQANVGSLVPAKTVADALKLQFRKLRVNRRCYDKNSKLLVTNIVVVDFLLFYTSGKKESCQKRSTYMGVFDL